MKRSSFFYAILFLLISPLAVLAVDINLKENSSGTDKAVSVEMNTKGEKVSSFKIAVQVSDNVNVLKIEEGEYPCGTFSSTQNGTTVEITCTTKEEEEVNASVAKINFTADTTDYSFTVLGSESQVGDLSIDSTADIKPSVQETNNDVLKTTNDSTTTTQQTPTTASQNKTKKLTDYLPYALLGVAGVLLLSIIVLLATKGKKDSTPTSTAHVTQPPIPTETTEEKEEKPTIQEMVNAGATSTEIVEEPTTTTTPTGNHEKDLEALLMSERPGVDATITPPVEAPTEISSVEPLTTPVETPIAEVPTVDPLTIPTDTPTDETPLVEPFAPPVETPVVEVPTVDPLTMPTDTPTDETPLVEPFAPPVETPVTEIPLTDPLTTSTETPAEEVSTVEPFAIPTDTPISETPSVDSLSTPEVDDNQVYVANTSQGGLPSIGFTSPTQVNPTNNHTDIYSAPTETTHEGVNTNFPTQEEIEVTPNQEAMDLQALVNNEVNNIPVGQPPVVEETTPTTE